MPKTLLNPIIIDDRLRTIERQLSEIAEKIFIYSSPCSFSESISLEERKLQEIEDRQTLDRLNSQKKSLEDEKLRLTADKMAIIRAREQEADKKRRAARQGVINRAKPIAENIKMNLEVLDHLITQLMEIDRECSFLGEPYLRQSSQGSLNRIRQLAKADEIVNLRTIE